MNKEELNRQYRLTDQMLTIYSVLRDRYSVRATALTLGILGSSVILCACTFLPEDALAAVGISPLATKVTLGTFSSLVLFLSIAELRVDWKERSRCFAEAAEKLAQLKFQHRMVFDSDPSNLKADATELTTHYEAVMKELPRVPDRQFVKLKAYHLRKVRLSQLVDSSPGCPLWILRLRLLYDGLRGK